MRIKLLLFLLLLTGGLVSAQDTIRTLIITEAHLGAPGRNFVEITNVGTEAVQLSNFEIGRSGNNFFTNDDDERIMLPEKLLEAGESFFIANINDYGTYVYETGLAEEGFGTGPVTTPPEIIELADIGIYQTDISGELANAELDSVSEQDPIGMYFGRQSVYLRQYFKDGETVLDSVVVDQVMGVFDTPNEDSTTYTNKGMAFDADAYDVAGYPAAGSYAHLIRKYSVKQGNLTFVRGDGESTSEWIALTNLSGNSYRAQPWTYKNHGDYNLDENTLVSDVADIDFANKTITVPWGTLRPDGVMKLMEKKPGVSWFYNFSPIKEDSLAFACKTGDWMEVIVCGNDADRDTFEIIVSAPTESDNFVVPVPNEDPDGAYVDQIMTGHVTSWPRIIEVESGMDTITGSGWIFNLGLPNALRVDSLLERLEKPAIASWEIVPVDDNETRPDLLDGDILRVTAQNGDEKDYYLKVKEFEGTDEARLAYITWPDIPDPDLYEYLFNWKGDTVPNFSSNTYNYQLKLPSDVENVPATVAKTIHENATIEVSRATNLMSYVDEDRTTVYKVTAEDDSTELVYKLEWQKEQSQDDIQPYQAEPFVSEYIMRYYFGDNFLEICNPGNMELDLSNYMIVAAPTTNPAEAIQFTGEWLQRYRKYVPGHKWVDSVSWAINPGYLEAQADLGVNPVVQPGDVFCLSEMRTTAWWGYGRTGWTDSTQVGIVESDVQFFNTGDWASNPWGENVNEGEIPIAEGFSGEIQYIFKILNDSIQEGLKPATDPNDFELIEVIGNLDQSAWMFGNESTEDGHNFTTFIREPEYVLPKANFEESFGDTIDTPSEWHRITRYSPEGVGGWPEQWIVTPMLDWGKHYFIPTTTYLSTVSSNVYNVSTGYEIEDIEGLVTGVTVSEFLGNIDKANENQTLVVVSSSDGSELTADDAITATDTLVVTSANGDKTTKYVLSVTDEGLSSDALITSTEYTVTVDTEPSNENAGVGSLSGFDYGTALSDVLDNITLPAGAKITVLDTKDQFVPLTKLNYDTLYVATTVNNRTMLQVTAEDNVTTINYWLIPGSADEAIVVSDVFDVDQEVKLIDLIPDGIAVSSLFDNLFPSTGATIKVVDKSGLERTGSGIIRLDDKVVVTSESGEVSNTYFLAFLDSESPFLIYVVSSVYAVDQIDLVIDGIETGTDVATMLGNLAPSLGATVVVLDVDGNEKATDAVVSSDDVLKVTSSDGNYSASYSLGLVTSVNTLSADRITMYPNPTNGLINISGLNAGEKVQVFNLVGSQIFEFNTNSDFVKISLDNQPSGMYIIVVSDNEKMIGRYKAIKR